MLPLTVEHSMGDVSSAPELERAFAEPSAVLLKHGATCPISRNARTELAHFAREHPEVPVYLLEVTGQRELSDRVAERLGVPHESPQAFVLRDGQAAWHTAHYDITARAVAEALSG